MILDEMAIEIKIMFQIPDANVNSRTKDASRVFSFWHNSQTQFAASEGSITAPHAPKRVRMNANSQNPQKVIQTSMNKEGALFALQNFAERPMLKTRQALERCRGRRSWW